MDGVCFAIFNLCLCQTIKLIKKVKIHVNEYVENTIFVSMVLSIVSPLLQLKVVHNLSILISIRDFKMI